MKREIRVVEFSTTYRVQHVHPESTAGPVSHWVKRETRTYRRAKGASAMNGCTGGWGTCGRWGAGAERKGTAADGCPKGRATGECRAGAALGGTHLPGAARPWLGAAGVSTPTVSPTWPMGERSSSPTRSSSSSRMSRTRRTGHRSLNHPCHSAAHIAECLGGMLAAARLRGAVPASRGACSRTSAREPPHGATSDT